MIDNTITTPADWDEIAKTCIVTSTFDESMNVEVPIGSVWYGYNKQVEFFSLGSKFKVRYLSGGNRVGKSFAGMYEIYCHLTQTYPSWWRGLTFKKVKRKSKYKFYILGLSYQALEDNLQPYLFQFFKVENIDELRKHKKVKKITIHSQHNLIKDLTLKSGARLCFRSVESRQKLQGINAHFLLIDEEFTNNWLFNELLMRIVSTDGQKRGMIITATPTLGFTEFQRRLRDMNAPTIRVTWDDVPHLTEEEKEDMMARLSPAEREARSQGIARMGGGLIYPMTEAELNAFYVEPFEWKGNGRYFTVSALDMGWHDKAVSYYIIDRITKNYWLAESHKLQTIDLELDLIPFLKVKRLDFGDTIIGDTSMLQSDQKDGTKIKNKIEAHGFKFINASKGVESGLMSVRNDIREGRLKAFKGTNDFFEDERISYHKDENGKIVKQNDHILDTVRYFSNTIKSTIIYKTNTRGY